MGLTLSQGERYYIVINIVAVHCVGVWLSLVEHTVRDRGVAGSNPVTPTIFLVSIFSQSVLSFPSLI